MTRGAAGPTGSFAKRLELLVLFRLIASATPPSRAHLAKALGPFARGRVPESEWHDAVEQAIAALAAAGEISAKPLRLAESGRARALDALGLATPPESKNWSDFKRRYLCGFVLGKPRAEGRALDPMNEVLARALGVELPAKATRTRLLDAWLARKLALQAAPITLNSLRAELLARELGVPLRAKSTLASTVKIAAARAANSAKADPQSLVDALTAEWLRAASTPPEIRSQPVDDAPMLEVVVSKVKAALDRPDLRRFGANKVFIASLWEALRDDPELAALGEQGFKQALLQAHRAGAVELARADLVSAMNANDVAASEISYLNSTYHFVHAPEERP